MTTKKTRLTVAVPIANPTPNFTPVQTDKSIDTRDGQDSAVGSPTGLPAPDWDRGGGVLADAARSNGEPHFGQNDAFAGRSVEQVAHRAVLIDPL
jgi:hypothetical protein